MEGISRDPPWSNKVLFKKGFYIGQCPWFLHSSKYGTACLHPPPFLRPLLLPIFIPLRADALSHGQHVDWLIRPWCSCHLHSEKIMKRWWCIRQFVKSQKDETDFISECWLSATINTMRGNGLLQGILFYFWTLLHLELLFCSLKGAVFYETLWEKKAGLGLLPPTLNLLSILISLRKIDVGRLSICYDGREISSNESVHVKLSPKRRFPPLPEETSRIH